MQVEIYVICYAKGQITHNQNGPFDFKICNGYRLGTAPLKATQLHGWGIDVRWKSFMTTLLYFFLIMDVHKEQLSSFLNDWTFWSDLLMAPMTLTKAEQHLSGT